MGDGGSVKFSPKSRAIHDADTTLRFTSLRTNKGGTGELKAIYTGYRPTVFLAALILATPIPWRRRGLSLLWGVLLVCGFVAVRVWLRLAVTMSNNDAIQAYVFSGWLRGFLGALDAVFMKSPAVGYMVPALIWIVVTLRREDWARFGIRLGADDSQPQPAAPASTPHQ